MLLEKLIPTNFTYENTWHTYAIEWSPSKMIWYIDGCPLRISPNSGITDPVRIIFNIAIEPWALPNESTPFPSEMLVDFIRIYKLKKDCYTDMNMCNYDFSTHDNKVKKSITIGNDTCSNTIYSDQNIYLRASDGVIIKGDFTMSLESELYIDVNACY